MRLVRLKLRASPFWNLPPIELSESQNTSPLLDVDLLSEDQQKVINKSLDYGEILLIGADGEKIKGNLGAVNMFDGNTVSSDDIEEYEDEMPEIVSVTAIDEGGEEDGEEEKEGEGPGEEVLADAAVLLDRNGNTVKKAILSMSQSDENLMLLHACLLIEEAGKKRRGVLQSIEQAITEY